MEDRFQVGVITTPHGVRGELKVFPTTDDPRRFKKLTQIILDTGKENKILKIQGVKFFKQFVILKFEGFDNKDDVECFRQKSLYVMREQAVKLYRDEYFIADLLGLKVLDEEEKELGVLKDVMETGANDVYVVDFHDGREVLLPAIKQCILEVNVEAGYIKVHLMDGLLEEQENKV